MKNSTTIEQCITALEEKGGFVTQAALALGISYQALSKRISKNRQLKDAYQAINERYVDHAESQLQRAIKRGEAWAICFYLKCKGKHRGWVERQEFTGAEGGPMKVSGKLQVQFVKPVHPEEETPGEDQN